MKKQLLFLVLIVSLSSFAFSQQQKIQVSDSVKIIRLENDWATALLSRNESVFNKLLADDFIYTENEKLYTRAEVIQSVMSVADTVNSAYNQDMKVHIKEKTAIVTGWLFVNGKGTGGSFNRKYRFTDVWYNEKGNWKLIAAHDYLVP